MAVNPAAAAATYARQAGQGLEAGMEPRSADPGKSFAELLGDAAKDAIATGQKSELMSVKGLAGQANIDDVVMAVNNAELTLQTVVAVRDRVIQAYQDIIRMPI